MINMKEFRVYLLLALLVVLLVGFIVAGKTSPAYKSVTAESINCNSVNLGFSAFTSDNVTAPRGTNTFFTIGVKNTGNVTETISLSVTPVGSVPFSIESAKPTDINASQKGFTRFGVYSPAKTGTYSVVANVSAGYLNCINYKTIPINVTIPKNATS